MPTRVDSTFVGCLPAQNEARIIESGIPRALDTVWMDSEYALMVSVVMNASAGKLGLVTEAMTKEFLK